MYFDFMRLINKYSCTFKVISKSKGSYDDIGNFVADESEIELTGAIISIDDNKIYKSSGTLTDKDKYLFVFEPLDLIGSTIIYKNKKYSVESQNENAEFTGIYQFTLKYVSAFDKGGNI